MLVAYWPAEVGGVGREALERAGLDVKLVDGADRVDPDRAGDWAAFVIELGNQALPRLRAARRASEDTGVPILVIVSGQELDLVADEGQIADFVVAPANPDEVAARVIRLTASADGAEILRYEDLELNTATYQASVAGGPVDLTYMEYELLRFFVAHRGRVWSREQLLSKVWGYEYFGGARTVDVHVRRLRAKLGESRASWITTVRSVGYRFG